MDGKDNRSKEKRSKMKQHHSRKAAAHRPSLPRTTSSSSQQLDPVRGVVDIADSSDEIYNARKNWGPRGIVANQRDFAPRDLLDDPSLDEYNDNDVANAQMRAGDFDKMAQMPTSIGGHFQFSSEKNWESASEDQLLNNTAASEYFTLNLKLLNAGLQTLPFYKRMDYPTSMFTVDQLASMDKAAELAEQNYQKMLKESEANPSIKINSGSRRSNSAKSQNSMKAGQDKFTASAPDELDELLNMATNQMGKVDLESDARSQPGNGGSAKGSASGSVVENKDDIQEWLDNVLEE